jgi:hypothetical protein
MSEQNYAPSDDPKDAEDALQAGHTVRILGGWEERKVGPEYFLLGPNGEEVVCETAVEAQSVIDRAIKSAERRVKDFSSVVSMSYLARDVLV